MNKWIIDKSALARLQQAAEPELWATRINRGLVAISTLTRLEVGYSARNGADHDIKVSSPPLRLMPVEYLTPQMEDRALWVQRELAARGQHRALSVPDLLIAATAELSGRTLLHLDKDFKLIADVTGQPMERLAVL